MGFFANGQKSLVPIGGNFFATPDTPADPKDCDRYPNSPYCGGGFLDITPLRIIPQIVADECNFGVAIQGTLGFVRLPVLQVVHRNPNCNPPPPPPPHFPPPPEAVRFQLPMICPCLVVIDFGCTVISSPDGSVHTQPGMGFLSYLTTGELPPNGVIELVPRGSLPFKRNDPYGNTYVMYGSLNGKDIAVFYTVSSFSEAEQSSGYVDAILPCFPDGQKIAWGIMNIEPQGCKPFPPFAPPTPPTPPKMECCPGQSNNDALLKLILKRIGNLPVEVPASYLTKKGVQPAQTKQIESLVDFTAWFAERFDEMMGEFEITIEINDGDLSKKGNQKQTIQLPNLGEAIAEIFSLLIHSKINNDLILNIVNRNLIESGQIKQTEFKTFSALNALIEYVGFPTNSTSEKMPLTFKPGELSFDKFLKEGEIDVSVLTYTDKNTLAAAMHTLLQAAAIIRAVHFRKTLGNDQQIASTIKNDLTQFLGDNGNLSEQIKTFLGNVEKVYDGINNQPS